MKLSISGFEILPDFISPERLKIILDDLGLETLDLDVTGIRNIEKKLTSISDYLASEDFLTSASNFLSPQHKLVRAILFNKTSETNWYVTWHQDKTLVVSKKFDHPDWKNWSVKEGVLHVQPPLAVLETMVTIRIHLDDATKENGCLKVIPGSHQFGFISQSNIPNWVNQTPEVYCEALRGDALIMRPLILHASSKSLEPSQRRVLHLEFSDWILPDGIDWA